MMREIEKGKFILFLDGFDEMSAQISVVSRFENFNKLSVLLKSKSICILTCRSSYFISNEEYRSSIPKLFSAIETFQGRVNLLGKKLDDKYINKGTLDYHEQSQIITNNIEIVINPLTENQIRAYFDKCSNEFREKCNSNPNEIYNFILGIYDLGDLITKPILLSIITDTILLEGKNYLKSDIKYGHSALYEKYTELILKRDWGKGEVRQYLSMNQRNRFAEAIAITMLYKGVLEVNYSDIINVIHTHEDILAELGEKNFDCQNLEFIASDIQICSFLKRTDENTFKFVHKSFMEFFVAQLIVMQLLNQENSNVLSEIMLNKEILFFIGGFGVYKTDIQKKIFSTWRKYNKSKNKILKRNLDCAFLLSKIEHNNIGKNTFNISDINVESISMRKISFNNINYNNINFENTDFSDININNSILANTEIENSKINKTSINNSILKSTKLHKVFIDNSSFKFKNIDDCECKELESKDSEYHCNATKLNIRDSFYQKCSIKNELTESDIKRSTFKNCHEIYLYGKNNIFELVTINDTKTLVLNGSHILKECKIAKSTINVKGAIVFLNCEFKNCQLIGDGKMNLSQYINCRFDNCLFADFYIEYDFLFYPKKDKTNKEYLDRERKTERVPLDFNNCTGIILTNDQFMHTITSTLLVFDINNYHFEINNYIKQKEESIKKWHEEETIRKDLLKAGIEKIRNEILMENGIINENIIDEITQEKINKAIKKYKDKNARVITDNFDEKRESEFVIFLKKYSDFNNERD